MTAIQHILFRRMCKAALMTLLTGYSGFFMVHAQQSGPTVNECSSGEVDNSYGVEETVCLSGNQSGLNAYAEVDNGGGGSGAANWVGVDATLLKSSTTVWNSGDNSGGTEESVSDSVVPTLNVWYTLNTTFDEGVCNYGGCNSWYGMGGLSVAVEVTASAPPAPTSLTATAGVGQVTLNWSGSTGATSYNLYQGTSAGGEGSTPVATGITSSAYIVTGLVNGTTYYFKVAAVGTGGTSGYSNEASATPQITAPADLGATAGNQQALLSWAASPGASTYNVYQGTSSGGENSTPVATGVIGTAFNATGLSNGTTYYFKVKAVSYGGTSGYSNEASASPIATGSNVYNYSTSYDGVGNVTNYSDSVMGSWSMVTGSNSSGYDSLNRLIAARATAGPYYSSSAPIQATWSIDDFGNRMTENLNGSPSGNVPIPASTSLSYSAKNQVQSVQNGYPPEYDAAGNVLCDGYNSASNTCYGNQYTYDADGRLCAVSGSGGKFGYLYDANGNRVAKGTILLVNGQLSCDTTHNGFTVTSSYILDLGGQQLSELAWSGGTAQWAHTNAWAGGQLVATYSRSGGQVTMDFHFTDWLGTRRILTDYAGNNQQTCHSMPYGNGEDCPTTPNEHLFTQKERDSETNNDYFGARYYSSAVGRFLSPDLTPFGIAPGDPQSWNLYSYARNKPLSAMDSGGMWYTPVHKEMIDIALGGLMSAGELAVLKHQQDVMDANQSDQTGHFMANPGESPAEAEKNSTDLILGNIQAATVDFSSSDPAERQWALIHLGDAMHTLQDMTSPMHTGDNWVPKVFEWGPLGIKGFAHWAGENDPSCDWSRFGDAIRLTLAAYVQADPGDAAKHGLNADNFMEEANRRISNFVSEYFDSSPTTSPLDEDAARQCALGNAAACDMPGNMNPFFPLH